MLRVLEAVRSMLNESKVGLTEDSKLIIRETGRQATLKSIEVVSVGQNAFSLKLDECGFPGQKTFAVSHAMHRACDAVAFCVVDGEPFILCFELKSSEPSRSEAAEQFRSAHCFLDYLDSLLQTYCQGLSIKEWPRRYFLFHNQGRTPLGKDPSVNSFDNSNPDRPLFIPVSNGDKTYLRKLLGKPL